MAKANDTTDEAKAKAHPDYKLITTCVEYGFTMGAATVAFQIDPTDAEFASVIDSGKIQRGNSLLIRAADIQATTLDGLTAKARTAQAARKLMSGGAFDVGTEGLLLASLVADVCRFHEIAGGGRSEAKTSKPFGGAAQ